MSDAYQQAVDSSQTSEMRLVVARLDVIARDVGELKSDIKAQMADHESRLRLLETKVERIDSRVNMFSMLQAAYATIIAGIAGFIGAQR